MPLILPYSGLLKAKPLGPGTSGALTDSDYATSVGTSVTFSGKSIGGADADRVVIVSVSAGTSATNNQPTVTIGGNAATKIVEVVHSGDQYCQIWALAVASGTTADIVVADDGADQNLTEVSIAVYRMIRASANATATDTAFAKNTSSPVSMTVTTDGDGFSVANGAVDNTDLAFTGDYTPDVSHQSGTEMSYADRFHGSISGSHNTTTTHSATGTLSANRLMGTVAYWD